MINDSKKDICQNGMACIIDKVKAAFCLFVCVICMTATGVDKYISQWNSCDPYDCQKPVKMSADHTVKIDKAKTEEITAEDEKFEGEEKYKSQWNSSDIDDYYKSVGIE